MARVQSAADAEESFCGALSGQKLAVSRVDIAGEQLSAVGVGARHDQRRDSHHIGR